MAERVTMEDIIKDREGGIRFLQNTLMEFGIDLNRMKFQLGTLSKKQKKDRKRLRKQIKMLRAGINSAAKQLVDLEPELRCEPEGVLKILPVVEENSVMYFVDSNVMRILVLAPTAAIARTAVTKMVDGIREQGELSKVCRCLKKYVDGEPIRIRGVYFVCDLAEAVRDG